MSAILSTYIHKYGSSSTLQNYCEKDGRSLATDFSPLVLDRENWSNEFDNDRYILGKNLDGYRKCYHFVISPDPTENADLDTVRKLATKWAEEQFPDGKYVINYHNDNGKIHAHIALNSIQYSTLKQWRFDEKQWADLPNSAHRVAENLGLDKTKLKEVQPPTQKKQTPQYKQPTYAEKRMADRGFVSWKQTIRNIIDKNKKVASNWKEFELLMFSDGIEVRTTNQGLTFAFLQENEKGYKYSCKNTRLGTKNNPDKYSRENIVANFNFSSSEFDFSEAQISYENFLNRGYVRPKVKPPKVTKLPKAIYEPIPRTYKGKLTRATKRHYLECVDQMATAIRIVDEYNVKSKQDLLARQGSIDNRLNEIKQELSALENQFDYYVTVSSHYFNTQKEVDEYNIDEITDSKNWLASHNISIPQAYQCTVYRNQMRDQLNYLDDLVKDLEYEKRQLNNAYNIINEIVKPASDYVKPRTRETNIDVTAHALNSQTQLENLSKNAKGLISISKFDYEKERLDKEQQSLQQIRNTIQQNKIENDSRTKRLYELLNQPLRTQSGRTTPTKQFNINASPAEVAKNARDRATQINATQKTMKR